MEQNDVVDMAAIGKAIANRLREFMDLHELTQEDMAARLGVSQPQIFQYLSGKSGFSDKKIVAICSSLGIKWQELDVEIPKEKIPSETDRQRRVRKLASRLELAGDETLDQIEQQVDLILMWEVNRTKGRKK